jgi:HAD superfamily hydrolase (TIGR01459 family)
MSTAPLLLVPPNVLTPASELAEHYDGWLCDVWGVVHNGVSAFEDAVDALCRYRAGGGYVVLITNAPRPSRAVYPQLERLGVPREAFDTIVTSGDVTQALVKKRPNAPLFHLGPLRDHVILEDLPNPIVDKSQAELCLLTGPMNDSTETVEDYDGRLAEMLDQDVEMLCANPDLVVRSGDRLVICAGSIARRYSEMGGRVTIAGKPQAPIYVAAMAKVSELAGRHIEKNRLLAVGDGLPTDIKGAALNGFDVYFITGGIHAAELGDMGSPDGVARVAAVVENQYSGIRLAGICDRLRWT